MIKPQTRILSLIFPAIIFLGSNAFAVPATVPLGTTSSFAVLAGQGITVAGAVETTVITGDIGTHPLPAITGLQNVLLNGVNQADNGVTQIAKDDLIIAYDNAASRTADVTFVGGSDLVGFTLLSGVYKSASSLFLSGALTLDAANNPDAVFIFQVGSELGILPDSSVSLINGAQACHVFWQVGSSATLGTSADFMGNILALTSITLNTGANIEGRLLARNGAVTLDNNTITKAICDDSTTSVPDAGNTILMLSFGIAALLPFKRSFSPRKE